MFPSLCSGSCGRNVFILDVGPTTHFGRETGKNSLPAPCFPLAYKDARYSEVSRAIFAELTGRSQSVDEELRKVGG